MSRMILTVGETKKDTESGILAIKLSRQSNNKTPVVLIQLETIQTILEPKDPDVYYAVSSKCEIHKIIKKYDSIVEFKKDHPKKAFFSNNHWKHRVEEMLDL